VRVSTKGRYAVMAMVDLAQNGAGRPIVLADVAARQQISLSYLEQLFARLRRAGLVTGVRGPGGGYRLARAPDATRIADIMLAVEEPMDPTRCGNRAARGCMGKAGRCATHDLWEELGNQIYLFLSGVSLADVLAGRVLGASRAVRPVEAHAVAAE